MPPPLVQTPVLNIWGMFAAEQCDVGVHKSDDDAVDLRVGFDALEANICPPIVPANGDSGASLPWVALPPGF